MSNAKSASFFLNIIKTNKFIENYLQTHTYALIFYLIELMGVEGAKPEQSRPDLD